MLICWAKENPSVAAWLSTPNGQRSARWLEVGRDGGQLGEGVGAERIMHPATFLAIGHEAGVLEHFQMEGETRLCDIEGLLQVAHATLAVVQHLDDREARLVGQRVEELGRS